MSFVAGQIIEGKYRILRELGVGGMGAVYEGENLRIHRKVAIKILHAAVAQKADIVQRFEREAQAAGRIGSAHIVEVLDLGNLPGGERFMVMEFLDGESLTSRIKKRGRVSTLETAFLLRQLLEGLGAAHAAGIIHRDLKPDNVYLVPRNGQDFVKILDFGVSKFSATDESFSMTRTGAVMGTPYYMSPEQARGQPVDQRSDLYSIGVVAYQAVTGRVPFNAETFNELIFKIALETPEPLEIVVPGFDPGFSAIVQRAMAREPVQRFQNGAEFIAALDAWRAGAPLQQYAQPQGGGYPHQQLHPGLGQSGATNPGYQAGPSGGYANPITGQSGPGFGQSGANFGQSGANFTQSGGNPAAQPMVGYGPQGQNGPPGQNGGGPMGQSQVGVAITAQPPKGNGAMIAVIALVGLLGVGGGVGGYLYLGAAKKAAAASSSAASVAEATVATAAPAATADATAATTATADSSATAATTTSAATSAAAATAPPTAPTAPATAATPVPVRTAAIPKTAATATQAPPSTGSGGRRIGSEL